MEGHPETNQSNEKDRNVLTQSWTLVNKIDEVAARRLFEERWLRRRQLVQTLAQVGIFVLLLLMHLTLLRIEIVIAALMRWR